MDHAANVQRGLAWIREMHPDVTLTTDGLDMSSLHNCIAAQLPGGYLGVAVDRAEQFCVDHGFLIMDDTPDVADVYEEYDRLGDAWRDALAAER